MERSRVPLYMGHQVKSYFDNGGIRVSKYGTKRYQDFSILPFHPREETRGSECLHGNANPLALSREHQYHDKRA